jgi:drug/metabolite transporter (DMT)-like permease
MKPRQRLSFVIPVLLIVGTFYSIWAYYTRGISGLRTRSEVWLSASVAAILINLLVRKLGESTNHDAKDRRRLDPKWVVWMIFAGGAAAAAFLFGLDKNTAAALVTLVTVLLILVYSGFAIRYGNN